MALLVIDKWPKAYLFISSWEKQYNSIEKTVLNAQKHGRLAGSFGNTNCVGLNFVMILGLCKIWLMRVNQVYFCRVCYVKSKEKASKSLSLQEM